MKTIKFSVWHREQQPRGFKQQPTLKHVSVVGQHLVDQILQLSLLTSFSLFI